MRTTSGMGNVAAAGDADIAVVAGLLADPGRARVLMALADGRALPAGRLAQEAGMSASSASAHLAKLVAGGMLVVQRSGRRRYYRLSGPDVADVIEVLARVAPARPVRSLREGTRAHALRRGRTCYDHLAGRLGVAVTEALVRREVLLADGDHAQTLHRSDDPIASALPDVPYRLGQDAERLLDGIGVRLAVVERRRGRRPLLRFCMDWTEERHHLAGALGAGIVDAWVEHGWIRRVSGQRAVRVTPAGERALVDRLGVEWAD